VVHRDRGVGDVAVDVDADVETHHLLAELGVVVATRGGVRGLGIDADVDGEREPRVLLADEVLRPLRDLEVCPPRLDHLAGLVHRLDQHRTRLPVALDRVVV